MSVAPYYVWRRNDGLVSCCRFKPRDWVGADKSVTTFTHIGVYDTWEEAYRVIVEERGNASRQ